MFIPFEAEIISNESGKVETVTTWSSNIDDFFFGCNQMETCSVDDSLCLLRSVLKLPRMSWLLKLYLQQ